MKFEISQYGMEMDFEISQYTATDYIGSEPDDEDDEVVPVEEDVGEIPLPTPTPGTGELS